MAIQDDLHYKAFKYIFNKLKNVAYTGECAGVINGIRKYATKKGIYQISIGDAPMDNFPNYIKAHYMLIISNVFDTETEGFIVEINMVPKIYTFNYTRSNDHLIYYDVSETFKKNILSEIPEVDLTGIENQINDIHYKYLGNLISDVDMKDLIKKPASELRGYYSLQLAYLPNIDGAKNGILYVNKWYTPYITCFAVIEPGDIYVYNKNDNKFYKLSKQKDLDSFKSELEERLRKLESSSIGTINQTAQIRQGAIGLFNISPNSVEKGVSSFTTATAINDAPKLYTIKGIEYLDNDIIKGNSILKAGTYYLFTNFTNNDIIGEESIWGTTPRYVWFDATHCDIQDIQTLELNDESPWIELSEIKEDNDNEA